MKHSILGLFLFFMISCSSGNDEIIIPPTGAVTYSNSVKSIIDSKCLNCHGNPTANGAPMSLTNFDEVKEAVLNRGLVTRVENGSMPLGGTPLTTSQVAIIKNWRDANFPQ